MSGDIVESDIPARLDRLPWGRFHTLVVAALGITWILDGLEVTLAGSLAGALKQSPVLQFSNADIGIAASAYLAGAVLGALFFGWLTDRLGRKKLFFITLTVYLVATAATAFSWSLASFAFFRFVTGEMHTGPTGERVFPRLPAGTYEIWVLQGPGDERQLIGSAGALREPVRVGLSSGEQAVTVVAR